MFISEAIYRSINRKAERSLREGASVTNVIAIIARETGKSEEETRDNLMPAFIRTHRAGLISQDGFPADFNWSCPGI